MTEKKNSFYIGLGVAGDPALAALRLQLDADIYNTAILTATGLSAANPPATSKVIPVTLKTADKSNAASLVKCTVFQGADFDNATDQRAIGIICETSKITTALTDLIGKTINLGRGAGSSWKIARATV
jgi:hypothetical protein